MTIGCRSVSPVSTNNAGDGVICGTCMSCFRLLICNASMYFSSFVLGNHAYSMDGTIHVLYSFSLVSNPILLKIELFLTLSIVWVVAWAFCFLDSKWG
jgi:hypothetical protein